MKFNNRKGSIECIILYGQVLNVPLWSPLHFLRPLTHLAVDGAWRLALASYHNGYDMGGGGGGSMLSSWKGNQTFAVERT